MCNFIENQLHRVPGLRHSTYMIEDRYITNRTSTWLITHHLYMPQRWWMTKAIEIWLLEGLHSRITVILSGIMSQFILFRDKKETKELMSDAQLCMKRFDILYRTWGGYAYACLYNPDDEWFRQCRCHSPRALQRCYGQHMSFDKNAAHNNTRLIVIDCVHNTIVTWSLSVEAQSVQCAISLKSAL